MRTLIILFLTLLLAGCASSGPFARIDSQLRPVNGNLPPLQTATLQGRTVVVGLLNPYCTTCYRPFQDIDAAYERYQEDPEVAVLLVYAWPTLDNPSADIAAFTRRHGIETPAYWDYQGSFLRLFPTFHNTLRPSSASDAATVEPSVFVVDPSGEIVYRRVGNFSSEQTREELLAAVEQARESEA